MVCVIQTVGDTEESGSHKGHWVIWRIVGNTEDHG